jgi:hypothetical protein
MKNNNNNKKTLKNELQTEPSLEKQLKELSSAHIVNRISPAEG